jgi:hypothetical protein
MDKNKKKKNSKLLLTFKNSEILDKYKNDFLEEIKITINSLNKLEIKNYFYTPEANYEEVNINDNYMNKNNFIFLQRYSRNVYRNIRKIFW